VAQEAVARRDAEQAVARAMAARTRPERNFVMGSRVYFYRKASFLKKPEESAAKGFFLGPGIVVAPHGPSSLWIQYGGRVYLVA